MTIIHGDLNSSTMDSTTLDPTTDVSRLPRALKDLPELSRTSHTIVAVCLGIIFVLGFLANFCVLLVFARFQVLRTPINLILLNICVSDMLVCIFGTPFSFAASIYGRWLIGLSGCKWYGFANSLFGIVSLVSFAVLSLERYSTMVCCTKADVSDYRKAWLSIGGCWLYSLAWTLPPLFGWSSYGPEGPGTTCSVQWHQRSPGNVAYVTCLFVFCLLLPLVLMVYCYGKILMAIRGAARINQTSCQRRETHVLLMVLSMVSCYLLCWMPYGVVALLATFGRVGVVGPTASIIPSILAKSSTVLNPIVYVLFNNQFYRCFMAFVQCGPGSQRHNYLHTLQSSPALAGHPNCMPLSPLGGLSSTANSPARLEEQTPHRPAKDQQQCQLQTDKQSLVLVVHYTP
ncbi:teleost multiple tissue opsin 3b [Alosa alosa]|nr:teleost multiple tissue opsin 3b [Alosa sapidissima]XP_048122390.1 teleost multiple tissue opsin 3b [Alosa alosa]